MGWTWFLPSRAQVRMEGVRADMKSIRIEQTLTYGLDIHLKTILKTHKDIHSFIHFVFTNAYYAPSSRNTAVKKTDMTHTFLELTSSQTINEFTK